MSTASVLGYKMAKSGNLGDQKPPSKKEGTMVRVSKSLAEALRDVAKDQETTIADLLDGLLLHQMFREQERIKERELEAIRQRNKK